MKSNPEIVKAMQARYFDENVAENQYRAHAAILNNAGYVKAAAILIEHADDEAKHKGMLAKRLAEFCVAATPFGGKADAGIGGEMKLPEILDAELPLEVKASADYNELIRLCCENGDNDTREIIAKILSDETDHINDLERILGNIEDIGLENLLQAMMN